MDQQILFILFSCALFFYPPRLRPGLVSRVSNKFAQLLLTVTLLKSTGGNPRYMRHLTFKSRGITGAVQSHYDLARWAWVNVSREVRQWKKAQVTD